MPIEYKFLAADDKETLTNTVNEHLKSGWDLYGNPTGIAAKTIEEKGHMGFRRRIERDK